MIRSSHQLDTVVTVSAASPIRRSAVRAPGTPTHQISWPCVVATVRRVLEANVDPYAAECRMRTA